MLSAPPATTTSDSPTAMDCAARLIASSPDEHARLTVIAGTESGSPALSAARRATYPVSSACSTLPIITSSTSSGRMPARSTAALIAAAPRSDAGTSLNAPPNLPTGVRAPLTITTSCISIAAPSE